MGGVGTAYPAGPTGGRPRETDIVRAAADALFYLLRTGCPWRYLPRDGRFRRAARSTTSSAASSATAEAIAATLVEAERQRQGREPDATACIL